MLANLHAGLFQLILVVTHMQAVLGILTALCRVNTYVYVLILLSVLSAYGYISFYQLIVAILICLCPLFY